ncbi:MAG: hypothetical protein U5N55_10345 [Cypionkella sp.]|nr:hypothetical protein [Cypionkella sp.]
MIKIKVNKPRGKNPRDFSALGCLRNVTFVLWRKAQRLRAFFGRWSAVRWSAPMVIRNGPAGTVVFQMGIDAK